MSGSKRLISDVDQSAAMPSIVAPTCQPMLTDFVRPKTLSQLDFHIDTIDDRLRTLVTRHAANLPNLIFYGPKGAGKKTRVNCVLQGLYGKALVAQHKILLVNTAASFNNTSAGSNNTGSSTKASASSVAPLAVSSFATEMNLNDDDLEAKPTEPEEPKKQKPATKKNVATMNTFGMTAGDVAKICGTSGKSGNGGSGSRDPIACVTSQFHLELTPSDFDHKDFLVVRQCIKKFCENASQLSSIDACLGNQETVIDVNLPQYRVVIINHADRMSWTAQASLRRIMEQYMKNIRFILIAEQITGILQALCSRCALIRVPRPSNKQLALLLCDTAAQMQLGGMYGGDRSAWPKTVEMNDVDNYRCLPAPTLTMLLQTSRNDASYALMLMMHNSQVPAPTVAAANKKSRKRADETFVCSAASHCSTNPNSHLTKHSRLEQPSWVENTILIARALVLGYGIVALDESILMGWAADDVGSNSFQLPMLMWMRRVANELQTRCVPLNKFVTELMLAMLEQISINQDCAAQVHCKEKPKWWQYGIVNADHWSVDRCEKLRIVIVQLCAAFQQRIAVAFRAIVHLDALFVHLFEACEYHRHGKTVANKSDQIRYK